jgi:hypothetical protein
VAITTSIARAIPGDANSDGTVDGLDYLALVEDFGKTSDDGGEALAADFNFDGIVDGLDYILWSKHLGQSDPDLEPGYWVATTGNDTNPGTKASPFRTIGRAAEAAYPGDVVRIAAGAYNGWDAVRSGEPNRPITFVGAGTDTLIDGTGRTGDGFYADHKSYITIESMAFRWWQRDGISIIDGRSISLVGLEVEGCGWRQSQWDHGVALVRVDGISITGVFAHENYISGIYLGDCDHAVIDTCVTNANTGTSESDGLLVQNSRDVLIQDCAAWNNREDGIDVGGFEDTPTDCQSITIVRSAANENGGEGFAVSGTSGTQFKTYDVAIADCVARDNDGDGVQIYQRASDAVVFNSDISRNRRGFNMHSGAHDVDIIDNRVFGNREEPWYIDESCTNVVLTNNDTGGG